MWLQKARSACLAARKSRVALRWAVVAARKSRFAPRWAVLAARGLERATSSEFGACRSLRLALRWSRGETSSAGRAACSLRTARVSWLLATRSARVPTTSSSRPTARRRRTYGTCESSRKPPRCPLRRSRPWPRQRQLHAVFRRDVRGPTPGPRARETLSPSPSARATRERVSSVTPVSLGSRSR